MRKIFKSLFIVLPLLFLVVLAAPLRALASEEWLGLGLGWNNYTTQDIKDLGDPWVYNWGAGDTGNSKPVNDKDYAFHHPTDSDFAGKYVPTIFTCTNGAVDSVFNWITANNYAGPVIVFNEPDNPDQTAGVCSPGGDVSPAVDTLEYAITKRDTYYAQTKNYVDLIIGGTYASPNANWNWWHDPNSNAPWKHPFWMDLFLAEWQEQHPGQQWPNVEGVHVHSYHLYNAGDQSAWYIQALEGNFADQNGWNDWFEAHPYALGTKQELWVTETGILTGNVSVNNVNTIMNAVLPFYKNNVPEIKRVAWFTNSTNNFANDMKNTSLVDNTNGTKTVLWNTFKNFCTNQGYCGDPLTDVKDATVSGNFITNTNNGNPATSCPGTGEWCTWKNTATSRFFVQNNGDLVIAADPGTGYETCWLQWLNTAAANGETFRVKADFNSTFASGKSFFQIQTWDKTNFLPFNSTWSTTGKTSIDQNVTVYSLFGGRLALKFCAYGTETLTSRKTATLQNVSVTQVSGANVSVKDTTVTNNLLTNTVQWDNACGHGQWCRWYRDGNSTTNTSNILSGKFKIGTPGTSGNFGMCWIQWVSGATANGATYRMKGTADTSFGTNKTSFQIQTHSNEAYKIFYVNGANASIDQTFTVTDNVDPNFVAAKFCTWGTNSAAAEATLKTISLEKL